jgi:hypothetical protein
MTKKAMELSLSTVVVAIMLIIVLVVVVYIFIQRSSIFGKSIEGPTCTERGGNIIPKGPCPDGKYMIYAKDKADDKDAKMCCVPIGLK